MKSNKIWYPLVGYEGLYEINTSGEIKALKKEWRSGIYNITVKSKEEHLLSIRLLQGYPVVTLCKNGIQKQIHIHRLLAQIQKISHLLIIKMG